MVVSKSRLRLIIFASGHPWSLAQGPSSWLPLGTLFLLVFVPVVTLKVTPFFYKVEPWASAFDRNCINRLTKPLNIVMEVRGCLNTWEAPRAWQQTSAPPYQACATSGTTKL
eukprot:5743270-Amphidinium_carterae.1